MRMANEDRQFGGIRSKDLSDFSVASPPGVGNYVVEFFPAAAGNLIAAERTNEGFYSLSSKSAVLSSRWSR